MPVTSVKRPAWFMVMAVILLLWEAVGVYACYLQLSMGPASWPSSAAYERALYASLPGWYNVVYALATGSGLLGAIALVARRRLAEPLFVLSAIAIIVMFGYTFVTTDLIAHKGVVVATTFPVVILLIGLFAIGLARLADRRGWIG